MMIKSLIVSYKIWYRILKLAPGSNMIRLGKYVIYISCKDYAVTS